ncbi:MAG TPA: prepilin-type N-terminal cleavage/methylation domain-containing protein [Pyrinomonadaceae bacterium]|nr:prepilin-type N-terminal cleavage/methylation domain-containing protein [Pyrinomonadaceae bacterium]
MSGKITGRRALLSAGARGFSLIELVITITILTILTLGVMPLVKVSIKRQKEQQLRETLRQIRMAIDEFHRDTIGMNCTGVVQGGTGTGSGQPPPPQPQPVIDPRSKVYISDCTIFGVDNPDHYPPDLDTLVNGVNVLPRVPIQMGGAGIGGRAPLSESQTSTKKKVYLRDIPIDPMTGKQDWDLRSCYDTHDSTSWGGENVFDIRSKSKDTALNGERYSDW